MDTPMNVIDVFGVSYNLEKKIGEGSQGETFILEGGHYIAKLFKNASNNTELKSKINFMINLQLDRKYFASPLKEIMAPRIGYISEFASEMLPLSSLLWNHGTTDLSSWYESTGGLFKRYGVLIKLAICIRTLHAKGLVYCDLSPNNVFISTNPNKHNVFLIDLDNLRYRTSIIHNIYTPNYGAAEIVKNLAPNTPMSDCYSFAVIAYELLAMNHPLKGDMVNDGEPELEEQALRGELPWVEDFKDDSNSRETGIPSEAFITHSLQKLFHRTFEEGLNDPMMRPSIGEWVDALNDGINELLLCPDCHTHYPFRNLNACPFCSRQPHVPIRVKIQRWEDSEYYDAIENDVNTRFALQPSIVDEMYIDEVTSRYVKANHFLSIYDDYDTPIAKISLEDLGENIRLIVEPINDITLFFRIDEIDMEGVFSERKIFRFNPKRHNTMMIGIKNFKTAQRVLVI